MPPAQTTLGDFGEMTRAGGFTSSPGLVGVADGLVVNPHPPARVISQLAANTVTTGGDSARGDTRPPLSRAVRLYGAKGIWYNVAMNRKLPLILLALAALASHAAEPILLQWGTINTDTPAAQAESVAIKARFAKKAAATRRTAAAETRAAYLVQFPAAVTETQRTWLEATTQVRGYIPENAYIVWATPSEMDAIAASPDVFWTGEWKKEYKTVRTLAAKRVAA